MSLILTKYVNTTLTIIVPLTLSPSRLLLLVRLGVYIVNLCTFYFYRLIGKLQFFHGFKSSTSVIWPWPVPLPHTVFTSHLKSKVGNILTKDTTLLITLNIDGTPIVSKSHSPITISNLSSINFVSIFRCSSPSYPSALVFSL